MAGARVALQGLKIGPNFGGMLAAQVAIFENDLFQLGGTGNSGW
jgi:hypothetical protein